MTTLAIKMHNQVNHANQWVKQGVAHKVERTRNSFSRTTQSFSQSCRNFEKAVHRKFMETVNKIENFFYQNRWNLLFISCSVLTAAHSPLIFFATAISTAVIRIEMTRKLKELADNYLKDEHNPFRRERHLKTNPVEIVVGTAAAMDALAMGTAILFNPATIAMLPVVAGVAAGNAFAKWSMNRNEFFRAEVRA